MGVPFAVDILLIFAWQITTIQPVKVPLKSWNPESSQLSPENLAISSSNNENSGLLSSTKTEIDITPFKIENTPESFTEGPNTLREILNYNPYNIPTTKNNVISIEFDNTRKAFIHGNDIMQQPVKLENPDLLPTFKTDIGSIEPARTLAQGNSNVRETLSNKYQTDTSKMQYDNIKTNKQNPNDIMRELLNRVKANKVSDSLNIVQASPTSIEGLAPASNFLANQNPLIIQNSNIKIEFPSSVSSLPLMKIGEFGNNREIKTSHQEISNNLLNEGIGLLSYQASDLQTKINDFGNNFPLPPSYQVVSNNYLRNEDIGLNSLPVQAFVAPTKTNDCGDNCVLRTSHQVVSNNYLRNEDIGLNSLPLQDFVVPTKMSDCGNNRELPTKMSDLGNNYALPKSYQEASNNLLNEDIGLNSSPLQASVILTKISDIGNNFALPTSYQETSNNFLNADIALNSLPVQSSVVPTKISDFGNNRELPTKMSDFGYNDALPKTYQEASNNLLNEDIGLNSSPLQASVVSTKISDFDNNFALPTNYQETSNNFLNEDIALNSLPLQASVVPTKISDFDNNFKLPTSHQEGSNKLLTDYVVLNSYPHQAFTVSRKSKDLNTFSTVPNDYIISNNFPHNTTLEIPTIDSSYIINKDNIPVSKDTIRLESNIIMPANNFIVTAQPNENTWSNNLSFNLPLVPNTELPPLITKDFPINENSNSMKLYSTISPELIQIYPTSNFIVNSDIKDTNEIPSDFNRKIKNCVTIKDEDRKVVESNNNIKFFPNWQIEHDFNNEYTATNKEQNSMGVPVNSKDNFVRTLPNLPDSEIKVKEIGTAISTDKTLYSTSNIKCDPTTNASMANNTPISDNKNKQIELPNQIASISNTALPTIQTTNLFDSSRVLTLVSDKDCSTDTIFQPNNNFYPKGTIDINQVLPNYSLNVPCSAVQLKSPAQQRIESLKVPALPKSDNLAISSSTLNEPSVYTGPITISQNPVYKPCDDYYTDYISNCVGKLLPAITTNVISAIQANQSQKKPDSFTLPGGLDSCNIPLTSELTSLNHIPKKTVDSVSPFIINACDIARPAVCSEQFLLNPTPNKFVSLTSPRIINPCNTQSGYSEMYSLSSTPQNSMNSVTPLYISSETYFPLPTPGIDSPPFTIENHTSFPKLELPCKDTVSNKIFSENTSDEITDLSKPYIASITINVMPPKDSSNHLVIIV